MTTQEKSVADSLEALAQIGGAADGGVTRVAWSPELFAAYGWVGERLQKLGLEVEIDAAGNLIGRWETGTGTPVAVGSHLDTVPSGGRFDGALGVIAALHAVRQLQEEGFEPERPLWVVAFMDEEGTRFNSALFGSRAFTGEDVRDLGDRVDADGGSLRDAMAGAGFDLDRVATAARIGDIGAYLELHIEQGPVLEAEDVEIGVVTSIVGLRGYRVRLRGQANHAGTTPMHLRRDAFAGAARIAVALRDEARGRDAVTSNVGKISVEPGGANVVPGVADFTIDVRAATAAGLAELERVVAETVTRIAVEEDLEFDLQPTFALEPARARSGPRQRRRARCAHERGERQAAAERRRSRRDARWSARPRGDDLRPEPRRHQPLARGVQRPGPCRGRDGRPGVDSPRVPAR